LKSTTVTKILPDIPGLDLQNVSNSVNSSVGSSTNQSTSTTTTTTPSTQITHRVIYQAEDDGSFATYNPSYVVRKLADGREFTIKLPSKGGTFALLSDIEDRPIPDNVITREKLQACLEEAVQEDFPTEDYTMSELVDSHNKLLQALRNLIKEN